MADREINCKHKTSWEHFVRRAATTLKKQRLSFVLYPYKAVLAARLPLVAVADNKMLQVAIRLKSKSMELEGTLKAIRSNSLH